MSKAQRTKGANGEREIINLLKSYGIPAKRISMLETGGIDKGDILVAGVWLAEVKRGQHVPKFIYDVVKEGQQMLFCRRDRQKWKIVMDLEFFTENFIGGEDADS